jgi:plastocyanin
MTRRVLVLLLAVLAVALGVAACGGGDDEEAEEPAAGETDGGGGGTTLELAADPGGALEFDTSELTAPAGEVAIHLTNESSLPHNVEVEGNGVEEVSETITGSDTTLTLTLEAGEYEFYCAVGNHRETMNGTLTVE